MSVRRYDRWYYLRDAAAPQTQDVTDAELRRGVIHAEETARRFGVKSERAIGLWAFMLATNRTDFTQDWAVRRFMTSPDIKASADQRVRILFNHRIKLLRAGES